MPFFFLTNTSPFFAFPPLTQPSTCRATHPMIYPRQGCEAYLIKLNTVKWANPAGLIHKK